MDIFQEWLGLNWFFYKPRSKWMSLILFPRRFSITWIPNCIGKDVGDNEIFKEGEETGLQEEVLESIIFEAAVTICFTITSNNFPFTTSAGHVANAIDLQFL